MLKRVEETPKGPRLILSRGDPLFVKALFKLEVPEIQQNIVEIRAAAREVGSRTKIAVFSRDDSIDPVGACVGLKGSRVQAVVNELNGERIDIVPWSPDPERFAKLALAPAQGRARVQRSGARRRFRPSSTKISSRWRSAATDRTCASRPSSPGGRSISTRAASGWSAAAPSRRSLRRCLRRPRKWPTCGLSEIGGMPPATVAVLEEAGYRTLNDIIDLEREDFLKLPGIAPEEADRIMAMIDELTTEDGSSDDESRRADGETPRGVGDGEWTTMIDAAQLSACTAARAGRAQSRRGGGCESGA